MDIAQRQLSSFLNSTTPELLLNELVNELTPNRSSSLECLIFGNEGCQFICNLKCIMYGCVSNAICIPSQEVCDCRETYKIGNEYVSSRFFRFLPFVDLWDYRFEHNIASVFVTSAIKKDIKLTQSIGFLLQDPHITGTQIKNKMIRMFPENEWLLTNLKPIARARIDSFLSSHRHFDYPAFTYYLNEYIKEKYEDIRSNIEIKESSGIEDYLKDRENIKYMVRQLLLFPSEYMTNVMDTFSAITGISYEEVVNVTHIDLYTSQNPQYQLTSQQIDEILQAGALSQLVEFKTIFNNSEKDDENPNELKTQT